MGLGHGSVGGDFSVGASDRASVVEVLWDGASVSVGLADAVLSADAGLRGVQLAGSMVVAAFTVVAGSTVEVVSTAVAASTVVEVIAADTGNHRLTAGL